VEKNQNPINYDVEPWVNLQDMQTYLGASAETLKKWIRNRQMPAYQVGRLWKFKCSEVDEWIRSGGAARAGDPEEVKEDTHETD